jgi:hypothetical protein
LGLAAGLIAVSFFFLVTLLLYGILKPVNRPISLLAALSNLAGLVFEAARLNLGSVDVGIVLHGFNCVLVGYLVVRSTFLPSLLGRLMAFAGLAWLTFLLPSFAHYLYPYNLAPGFLCEASLMLWLLVMGVNPERWKEQVSAAGS